MAGIYARVDNRGVHKAPPMNRSWARWVSSTTISKAQQDGLNPQGVNCIRELNGNIRMWGVRTIGGDANGEWRYINVRRTFLFLRESIDEGTQWAVFEPNDAEALGQDHAQRHGLSDHGLAFRRTLRQHTGQRRSTSSAMPRPTRRSCASRAGRDRNRRGRGAAGRVCHLPHQPVGRTRQLSCPVEVEHGVAQPRSRGGEWWGIALSADGFTPGRSRM